MSYCLTRRSGQFNVRIFWDSKPDLIESRIPVHYPLSLVFTIPLPPPSKIAFWIPVVRTDFVQLCCCLFMYMDFIGDNYTSDPWRHPICQPLLPLVRQGHPLAMAGPALHARGQNASVSWGLLVKIAKDVIVLGNNVKLWQLRENGLPKNLHHPGQLN